MNSKECQEQLHQLINLSRNAIETEDADRIMKCLAVLHQNLVLSEQVFGMGLGDVFEIVTTVNRRHTAAVMQLEPEFLLSIIDFLKDVRLDHLQMFQPQLIQFLDILDQFIDRCSPLGFSEFWGAHSFPISGISHDKTAHGAILHLLLQQRTFISTPLDGVDFDSLQEQVDAQFAKTNDISKCIDSLGRVYRFSPESLSFKSPLEAVGHIQSKVKAGFPALTQLRSRLGQLHYVTVLDIEIEREVGFITTADELQIPLGMLCELLSKAPLPNSVWSIGPNPEKPATIGDLKLPPRS